MISENFSEPFNINPDNFSDKDLKEVGGMRALVKTNYGRNMWRLMEQFNVLPTDQRFKDLSNDQLTFIMESMVEDSKEAARRAKGYETGSYFQDDTFEDEVWNKAADEWELVKEGHDVEDIVRQMNEKTSAEYLEKLPEKFAGVDGEAQQVANGKLNQRDAEVSDFIDRQLAYLDERVKEAQETGEELKITRNQAPQEDDSKFKPLENETVKNAISMFDDDDDDDGFSPL